MQNQLVEIIVKSIGGENVNTVDARELHEFLESKQDFSTWIKSRIQKYKFVQGVDFIQFHNFVESDSRARIDYALTLDMAKELCMVENNEQGRKARKYFIDCEKQLKQNILPQQSQVSPLIYHASGLEGGLKIASLLGLKGDKALYAANRAMIREHGYNVLEIFTENKLITADPRPQYTATGIGEFLAEKLNKKYGFNDIAVSAQAVYKCLVANGFLEATPKAKNQSYKVLAKGEAHMELDSGEHNGSERRGVLMWETIIPIIEKLGIEPYLNKQLQKTLRKAA